MKNKNFKDSRLIDAFSYIDPKYIAEVADSLKLSSEQAAPVASLRKKWQSIAVLVACVILLGASIPLVSYVLRNFTDISSWLPNDTTEASELLTEPETPTPETTQPSPETTVDETTAEETTVEETTAEETTAEETTAEETTAEETTAEETTSPPEPEYDGSRGLEYKISEDGTYAILVGIGTCTDTDIVTATTYNGLPVTEIGGGFYKIDTIRSVTVSDNVTYIEGLRWCASLEEVHLPKSLSLVYIDALKSNPKLRVITIDPENQLFSAIGNCLIEKETKTIIVGCTGSIIPSDESVLYIGGEAFRGAGMTEITIPEGIERIDGYAFASCASLKSVYLPDSLVTLGYGVFYHSSALESVRIGKNLEVLGSLVFKGCTKLNSLSFPKTLKRMGEMVFMECKSLTSVSFEGTCAEWKAIEKVELWNDGAAFSIVHCSDGDVNLLDYDGSRGLEYKISDDGKYAILVGIGTCTDTDIVTATTYNGLPVKVIGERALFYEKVNSIRVSDTVEIIEEEALGAGKYTSLYISASVRQLEGAFSTCDRLESITVDPKNPIYQSINNCLINTKTQTLVLGCINSVIPADGSVTVIGNKAFEAARFTNITIPEGITEIGEEAFAWCVMLESIAIPDSVKVIGNSAFMDCERAKTLKLGKGVESIGNGAFNGCTSLTEFGFSGTVSQWNAIEKIEGWNEGCPFTVIHCSDGDVNLLDYDGSRGLEYEIRCYNGKQYAALVGIGTCTDSKIVTATYYNGVPVTDIDGYAFDNISGITSITVSEGVTHIGLSAFNNLPDLRAVYLPSTLESIDGGEGLAFCECQNIEIISVAANNPKFYSVGNCMIERNSGTLVFACKSSVIPTDGSIKSIGVFAFSGLKSISSIVIPEGVTEIKQYAFSGCTNLKSVSLPSSITSIKWSAFSGCKSLESINLGNNVKNIESRAFANCTSLREISLPAKVEYFGEEIFAGSAIESIVVPDGVTHLFGGMFINCKNLKKVTLPHGIERIGMYAFTRCTALTHIDIPASVKEIDQYAFSECTSLGEFYYLGTKTEWKAVTKGEYWNEGCPFTVVHCSDGDIFIAPISEAEAFEAARKFLGIDKSQIGGIYEFVSKEKDPSHLDCYRVAFCEWKADVGDGGKYEVLREVYVNQNTGECTEVVFDYPDIPEVFLDVIFNREKFTFVDKEYSGSGYTYKTEDAYLKTFKIQGEWLFGSDSQDYSLLDLEGDSSPELIFRNVPRNTPGLILRYYDGKVYGYTWDGDGLMTDCTNPWHESAGEVQVLDELYFDGLYLKSRELLRYDFQDPDNVKYYVEGKETTKAEYEKFAAKYDGEYLKYSSLDLYPVYVNPFPGG